jgi:hypothetical protein
MSYWNTVEACKTLSMKELRQWGYLHPNQYSHGTVTFRRGKEKTGSMGIAVSTLTGDAYLRLTYFFEDTDKHFDYKIPLVTVPSNLGKGYRYYFRCPVTGKRCLKLYRPPWDDYFLHRAAYPGLLYESQTLSKAYRSGLWAMVDAVFNEDKLYRELLERPKYAKLYYRGKPTPRMKRYLRAKEKAGQYAWGDFDISPIPWEKQR